MRSTSRIPDRSALVRRVAVLVAALAVTLTGLTLPATTLTENKIPYVIHIH